MASNSPLPRLRATPTAEKDSYFRAQLNEMLDYAEKESANSSQPSAPSSAQPPDHEFPSPDHPR
jgi:hypothetical protein